jgi:hypothetical protein
MLQILLWAMARVSKQLRGQAETQASRLAKAHAELGRRWFSRKDCLSLFPRLSTASANRDRASAVADQRLTSRGDPALTRYRFA